MTGVARAMQEAADTALVGSAEVLAQVADTDDGPAVFAPHQAYDNVYSRITLETPQVLPTPDDGGCGQGSQVYLTTHVWAQGPDASLVAADLADAVRVTLDVALPLTGRVVSAHAFVSATSVGDPDPTVEHVVVIHRYSVRPTA